MQLLSFHHDSDGQKKIVWNLNVHMPTISFEIDNLDLLFLVLFQLTGAYRGGFRNHIPKWRSRIVK